MSAAAAASTVAAAGPEAEAPSEVQTIKTKKPKPPPSPFILFASDKAHTVPDHLPPHVRAEFLGIVYSATPEHIRNYTSKRRVLFKAYRAELKEWKSIHKSQGREKSEPTGPPPTTRRAQAVQDLGLGNIPSAAARKKSTKRKASKKKSKTQKTKRARLEGDKDYVVNEDVEEEEDEE